MNPSIGHRQHLKPPVRASLGNSAKSIRAPEEKLVFFEQNKAMRFALQRTAGQLLWEPGSGKRQKFRVCHCNRSVQGEVVMIYRAPDGSKARFGGVMTCGSGWTCPVCAVKIGEVKREELSAANVQHVQAGGRVDLTTTTFPHELNEYTLEETMERFDKARQKFKNCAPYKAVYDKKKSKTGCIGCVTSLEITHGVNGWHPHLHMLSFTDRSINQGEIEKLKKAWVGILLKYGLGDNTKINDMMERALDVRGGEDAANYIAKYGREEKWGITSELTRSHSKKGIGDGCTPFGLLALAELPQNPTDEEREESEKAAELFKEFADAFLGKRLINWSPGLRAKFGLQDDSAVDEEIAAKPDEANDFVGVLNPEQWRVVLRTDSRAALLAYAASCCSGYGQDDLDEFVETLKAAPVKSRGWFYAPMRPNPANFH
jgi:hypothetical protein